jgi:hypothetical protein
MSVLNYDKTCELLKNAEFFYSLRPNHHVYKTSMNIYDYPEPCLKYRRGIKEEAISISKLLINYKIENSHRTHCLKLKDEHLTGNTLGGVFIFYTSSLIEISNIFKDAKDIIDMFNYSKENRIMMHVENSNIELERGLMFFDPSAIVLYDQTPDFDNVFFPAEFSSNHINFSAFVRDQKYIKNSTIFTTKRRVQFYSLIPISFREAIER